MQRTRHAIARARVVLDRDLFPYAPSRSPAFSRWEWALVWGGVLLLAIVAQLFRLGPSTSFDSLWAEDGPIYLQSAIGANFFHAILLPYAGYLVLVPRLVAEAATLVPLRDAPGAIALLCAAITAVSGLVVWYASSAHIRNSLLRAMLVALTVLTPVAGTESVVSGAYVPWFMLIGVFWLLLWRSQTTGGATLGAVFILFTGLSTPGLWFFFPLAGLRLVALRDRRDALILGSYAVASVIQVPVLLAHRDSAVTPEWSNQIWTAYLQRIVDGATFGERAGGVAWEVLGWAFIAALCAVLLVALLAGLRRAQPLGRWTAGLAIGISVLMFVVSAYQRAVGAAMAWASGTHGGAGSRYAIVPALLLLSAALVLLDQAWQRQERQGSPQRLPVPVATAVLVLAAGLATSFYVGNKAARGTPPWDQALHSAADACATEGLESASVPISPAPFGLYIDCDRLQSYRQ